MNPIATVFARLSASASIQFLSRTINTLRTLTASCITCAKVSRTDNNDVINCIITHPSTTPTRRHRYRPRPRGRYVSHFAIKSKHRNKKAEFPFKAHTPATECDLYPRSRNSICALRFFGGGGSMTTAIPVCIVEVSFTIMHSGIWIVWSAHRLRHFRLSLPYLCELLIFTDILRALHAPTQFASLVNSTNCVGVTESFPWPWSSTMTHAQNMESYWAGSICVAWVLRETI